MPGLPLLRQDPGTQWSDAFCLLGVVSVCPSVGLRKRKGLGRDRHALHGSVRPSAPSLLCPFGPAFWGYFCSMVIRTDEIVIVLRRWWEGKREDQRNRVCNITSHT